MKIGDKEYPPLADGQYDYIVCGTGLKECILSGLLTHDKQKVSPRRTRVAATNAIRNQVLSRCGVHLSRRYLLSIEMISTGDRHLRSVLR